MTRGKAASWRCSVSGGFKPWNIGAAPPEIAGPCCFVRSSGPGLAVYIPPSGRTLRACLIPVTRRRRGRLSGRPRFSFRGGLRKIRPGLDPGFRGTGAALLHRGPGSGPGREGGVRNTRPGLDPGPRGVCAALLHRGPGSGRGASEARWMQKRRLAGRRLLPFCHIWLRGSCAASLRLLFSPGPPWQPRRRSLPSQPRCPRPLRDARNP